MDNKTKRHIINYLRQATVTWSGRNQALNRASRKVNEGHYLNGKEKLKKVWKCNRCSLEFRDVSQVEVDHIKEIGPFKGDWNDYIDRMFCGPDNLQVLCTDCHLKKTTGGNASLHYQRKKS